MARRRKTELCPQHFPNGLADQPADATVVSCEHGTWPVDRQPAPAADPNPAEGEAGGE